MSFLNDIDKDPIVQEANQNLKFAIEDYVIARSYGDENLSELAQIVLEADENANNTKKLSVLKKIKANLATAKNCKTILDKYKDRALASNISGVTIKVYDTSSASVNKYIAACNTCIKELKAAYGPYLKKETITDEENKEITSKVKEAIAKRNKIIDEVERTTEKRSTEQTISIADVKKAINYLNKSEGQLLKVSQNLQKATDELITRSKDKSKSEPKHVKSYIDHVNACKYSIVFVRFQMVIHSIDNAKRVITTAAYAGSKSKKKEDE